MSIYHNSQPTATNSFRANTDRLKSMAGVMSMSFTCRVCKCHKRCEGRKRVSKNVKDGYKCADCAAGG